jgi:competence protein ComFC
LAVVVSGDESLVNGTVSRFGYHPAYWLYRWFWSGLDWLYPPDCGGCGRHGARWCLSCHAMVNVVVPPICPKCGQMQEREELCVSCLASPPCFDALRSWVIFGGPIRNAIHQLKYKRNIALGEIFGRQLIECVRQCKWNIDIVVPVPLGIARLAERGYNQAALLARPLALGIGLSYRPNGLGRVRETSSQVDLNVRQRKENVAGAFRAMQSQVKGQAVLLVDDVATTGSTLDACASALREAGAISVYALTLARTSRPTG